MSQWQSFSVGARPDHSVGVWRAARKEDTRQIGWGWGRHPDTALGLLLCLGHELWEPSAGTISAGTYYNSMYAVGCSIFRGCIGTDRASGLLDSQPHRALCREWAPTWRGCQKQWSSWHRTVRGSGCATTNQIKSYKRGCGANTKSCLHRQLALKKPFWEEPRRKKVSFPERHASPSESKPCFFWSLLSALYWPSML